MATQTTVGPRAVWISLVGLGIAIVVIAALSTLGNGDGAASAPSPSSSDSSSSGPSSGTPAVPSPSLGTPSTVGSGQAVPVGEVRTLKPVPLKSTGDFGTGLTVRLTHLHSVKGVANAPGEISGPALKVIVVADNGATDQISLDGVVVFLSYGADRTPASEFDTMGAPLRGGLAAGTTRTGTYVFAVPSDQRGDVRVEVSYTGKAPTVAFEGSIK
jgi:hypothetical protein